VIGILLEDESISTKNGILFTFEKNNAGTLVASPFQSQKSGFEYGNPRPQITTWDCGVLNIVHTTEKSPEAWDYNSPSLTLSRTPTHHKQYLLEFELLFPFEIPLWVLSVGSI
jgi:hypothetical protein